ncbi:13600_t:CDS:2 [Rhizophagus irregularis]|nr:13600_t:CDS:2 [Rhizophagus irregularis]
MALNASSIALDTATNDMDDLGKYLDEIGGGITDINKHVAATIFTTLKELYINYGMPPASPRSSYHGKNIYQNHPPDSIDIPSNDDDNNKHYLFDNINDTAIIFPKQNNASFDDVNEKGNVLLGKSKSILKSSKRITNELLENITNENPFNHIQFDEPIFNTNDTNNSEFITVKTTIFPGISEASYIEVKKLQKLLISRKDDIDHILELQPVYTIGIDFQKNSTRPCIACWVAKSLDTTVLECLETIFEYQFEVIYKIATPLSINENNKQNLNSSNYFAKEFDNDNLTSYYNEESLEENIKEIYIFSDANARVNDSSDSSTQDFNISAKFWAEINLLRSIKTLKYNIDVYACGIGELLSKNSKSWLSLGYVLESIKVQVSPLPECGNGLFHLKEASKPTQLNNDVEHTVGDENNYGGAVEISPTPKATASYVRKKNNTTKYSKHKWEFKYIYSKGESWSHKRNNKLKIDEEAYAPGVHSGEWFVHEGMHGFCIIITQVLRYEIIRGQRKFNLIRKIPLQQFPPLAHSVKITVNGLNDFNGKLERLKKECYNNTSGINFTVGSNKIGNKAEPEDLDEKMGNIERSLTQSEAM